jgi:hypothetical protein
LSATKTLARTADLVRAGFEDRIGLDKAVCASSLAQFVRRGWHVLEPGTPYAAGKVIDAICEHLEAVTKGDINRLLINVPPGTAKPWITIRRFLRRGDGSGTVIFSLVTLSSGLTGSPRG